MEILFVCTGNTCRSPMAEHIVNKLGKGKLNAVSAGIHAFDGDRISDEAAEVLRSEYGIDASSHRARQLTADMISQADRVLTMTHGHKDALQAHFPQAYGKIMALKEAAGMAGDVYDPYGQGMRAYMAAAEEIKRAITTLIEKWNEEGLL